MQSTATPNYFNINFNGVKNWVKKEEMHNNTWNGHEKNGLVYFHDLESLLAMGLTQENDKEWRLVIDWRFFIGDFS